MGHLEPVCATLPSTVGTPPHPWGVAALLLPELLHPLTRGQHGAPQRRLGGGHFRADTVDPSDPAVDQVASRPSAAHLLHRQHQVVAEIGLGLGPLFHLGSIARRALGGGSRFPAIQRTDPPVTWFAIGIDDAPQPTREGTALTNLGALDALRITQQLARVGCSRSPRRSRGKNSEWKRSTSGESGRRRWAVEFGPDRRCAVQCLRDLAPPEGIFQRYAVAA